MTERQIADRRYFFLDSEAQYVALKATGGYQGHYWAIPGWYVEDEDEYHPEGRRLISAREVVVLLMHLQRKQRVAARGKELQEVRALLGDKEGEDELWYRE